MKQSNLPPNFPYHQGIEITIRSHVPPHPFGSPAFHGEAAPRPAVSRRDNPGLPFDSPLEWCLKFPPSETVVEEDGETGNLRILDLVACGAQRSAQVVRCQVNTLILIAKIFDAVYSRPEDWDYTYEADANYASEAAAYEDIEDVGIDGEYTPKYYGSWTFNLPVTLSDSHNLTRPVRMVLIEDIPGYSMAHIISKHLTFHIPPEDRLKILAEVFKIYSHLEFIGVRHLDLAPRNVMISGLEYCQSAPYTIPRVVLIDFNQSKCLKRPTSYYPMHRYPRPIDPRFYLGNYCMITWKGWVPEPHRSNPAAWRGWARGLWPDSEEFSELKRPMFSQGADFAVLPPERDVVPPSSNLSSDMEDPGGSFS